MPKKITSTKSASSSVVSEQPEEITVAAHVVAQPEVKIEKKAIIDSESEVENDKEEMNTIDALILQLNENVATMKELTLRTQQELKKLEREIKIDRKRSEKGKKKEKKVRNGTTGLDNELKVITADFRAFIEKHYQQLKDSDDKQIVSELKYDSDGSLLISRKEAHKSVNAYVKMQKLQYEDNGRRIHMDKTLQKLFPDNTEKKEKGVVTREENFYFTSVMKAISPHLASANPK
jgi:chromatin remodeling complex protein RSC6